MNKKGFTLIELLAVIVILAIIALIAVPIILNVIEKSKEGSAVDSAYGYIDAVEKGIVAAEINDKVVVSDGKYEKLNEFNNTYKISVKGEKPKKGYIEIEKRKVKSAELSINGYRVVCDKVKCNVLGKYEPIVITYDLDGGTLEKTKENIYKGDTIELPVPVKNHYGFDGWYTEKTGGVLVDNTKVFTESTTLYAHYTKNRYTITFDAGEGTSTLSSVSVDSGDTIENFPSASRDGYTFNGWYTSDNEEVTEETVITSSMTLYARYTIKVYTITYNKGSGTLTEESATVEHGSTLTLPTPTPPANYSFTGWYTASTGGSKVTNETTWTSSQTIYARYTQTEFNLATYVKGLVGKDSTVKKDTTTDQNTRYVGATVNNYVKFNNENWRIIGVFGNYTKIIKQSNTTTKKYNEALTYLDGDYYNGLNATAKNMIQSYSWRTNSVFYDEAAVNVYNTEKNVKTTYKISLLNYSDYLFAADSSCWTSAGMSTTCAGKNWIYINTNNTNIYYLVLNRNGFASGGPLAITSTGGITSVYDNYAYRVMPSVYLKNTVKVTVDSTSNGTSSKPYKLSI